MTALAYTDSSFCAENRAMRTRLYVGSSKNTKDELCAVAGVGVGAVSFAVTIVRRKRCKCSNCG
jgi:hypothetical protein